MLRFLFLSLVCTAFGCVSTAQEPIRSLRLDPKHLLILADSIQAGQYVTTDRLENYFDLVNASEMSIQMKKPLAVGASREDMIEGYMAFLHSDMSEFTYEESRFVADVVQKMFNNCMAFSPDIFPDTLVIVKTHGRHYGDGVFYTRENCIVVPANELKSRKATPFLATMYHELFHVYSRLHPAKRAELYQLIGFSHIGLGKLAMPQALSDRVLYNPDGVDFAQKIALKNEGGQSIFAIPVISANQLGYDPQKQEFFGYLDFNLFEVQPRPNGVWVVVTQEDGLSSTLNIEKLPDFFAQIKDNTGYIIHPDEILADNFSFILLERSGSNVAAKFSAGGKQLLKDMEKVLLQ